MLLVPIACTICALEALTCQLVQAPCRLPATVQTNLVRKGVQLDRPHRSGQQLTSEFSLFRSASVLALTLSWIDAECVPLWI